jgi:hypothetical protein
MHLIKIPFTFYFKTNSHVDWDSLGVPEPEEDNEEKQVHDAYINPSIINYIEPVIGGEGSYVCIGEDKSWHTPLSVDEVAKLINEEADI